MDNSQLVSLTLSCSKKNELPQIAKKVFSFANTTDGNPIKVWLFVGELGAGKTTFIKELCQYLGVTDEVSSPTFSIINEYLATNLSIFHFDFYRINKIEEAIDIGTVDYLHSGNYCFIEWPQLVESILPNELLLVNIESTEGENRVFKLTKYE